MNVVDKDKRPLTAKSTDPSVERLQQRVHLKTEVTENGFEYGSTSRLTACLSSFAAPNPKTTRKQCWQSRWQQCTTLQ